MIFRVKPGFDAVQAVSQGIETDGVLFTLKNRDRNQRSTDFIWLEFTT